MMLLVTTTASQCGDDPALAKACTVLFRGLEVENGQVTDVLRRVCDSQHRSLVHKIQAWIERKSFDGDWKPVSRRTPLALTIPDSAGFDIRVSAECVEGSYRSGYEAIGRGEVLPGNPSGVPFDTGTTAGIFVSSPQAIAEDEHMRPVHGGYGDYLPPRGLVWVVGQLQRPGKAVSRRLRPMYVRRWPPREVSRYIGMRARITEDGVIGRLHTGSIGGVTGSEMQGVQRVYRIEFDIEEETVITHLPNPVAWS
jgi:hypothetical protein